jgi:predicted nucleic acid-binding protein
MPGHRFVVDDVSFAASPEIPDVALLGHRQITDAHLLGLARRNGLRLVTFDRSIRDLIVDIDERTIAVCVLG